MTGTGMNDYQHLVFTALKYCFFQSLHQYTVKLRVRISINFLEVRNLEIFFYMQRCFSPIACTPYHVSTGTVDVIRQNLV